MLLESHKIVNADGELPVLRVEVFQTQVDYLFLHESSCAQELGPLLGAHVKAIAPLSNRIEPRWSQRSEY